MIRIDKRIKFDESVISEENNSITLYFTAPKEFLMNQYPDAEYMTISVECLREYICADYATVECSPTKYDDEEEGYVDYDWCEWDIPLEEIEALIKLAEESGRM